MEKLSSAGSSGIKWPCYSSSGWRKPEPRWSPTQLELVNRQWRLVRRPDGLASVTDFEWRESPVPRLGPGEALVRNELLSLDPTNRLWMSGGESYLPPVNLGEVMRGICVGTVIES